MEQITKLLLHSLRCALFGESVEPGAFASLSTNAWKAFFGLSAKQGVLAIVYDVVSQLPSECQPPRNVRLQWALSVEAVENRHEMQLRNSALLAQLFATEGIRTIVMKGVAMGTYYPKPQHRECGDLDCFLTTGVEPIDSDGYERGNELCEQIGAKVNRDYYKDAAIRYRGLLVENHRFFLPVRGSRRMKALERHLRSVALRGKTSFVADTKLIVPSPDFNALFIAMHGLNHFISEGIKLRHILDWTLLLKAEQNAINWAEFYEWADRMKMTRFVDALTAISVEHFGLEIVNPAIHTTSPYAERILRNTLYESDGLNNKGYSKWKGRILLVKNKLTSGWKFHKIYQRSIFVELMKNVFAFVFEQHPKL